MDVTQILNNGPKTESKSAVERESAKPKFSEVWKNIQSELGKKPEKAREIKKTLDKDDFLRIMITQMQHQDPTKPFEADKLASEIAQITSVEQLSNVNQALKKLSNQNRPLERLAMTNLIGKSVVVDNNRFPYQAGENQNVPYELPEDASEVRLTILSSSGEKVLEKELGAQKSGANSYSWDGKKGNSLPAESGVYLVNVEAKAQDGRVLRTSSKVKSKIIGISYEGKEPVFLVGDSKSQSTVTLDNIVRIEDSYSAQVPIQKKASFKDNSKSDQTRPISVIPVNPNGAGIPSRNSDKVNPVKNIKESSSQIKIEKGFPNGLSELSQVEAKKGGDLNE